MEVTTADTSLDPWAEYAVQQRFEGQNLAALKKGTADAQSLTVSFWVKSNTTGTYILEVLDNQNSARHINQSYTINAANTWEYKTLTFDGDTSGTITYNNSVSLEVNWCLAGGSNFTGGSLQTSWGSLAQSKRKAGQLNLFAATSNTWQITGVQLEVGDTATPFEHRSYGDELARCQRYYQERSGVEFQGWIHQVSDTGGSRIGNYTLPVELRATPTFSFEDDQGTSNYIRHENPNKTVTRASFSIFVDLYGIASGYKYPYGNFGMSNGESCRFNIYNAKWDAEL